MLLVSSTYLWYAASFRLRRVGWEPITKSSALKPSVCDGKPRWRIPASSQSQIWPTAIEQGPVPEHRSNLFGATLSFGLFFLFSPDILNFSGLGVCPMYSTVQSLKVMLQTQLHWSRISNGSLVFVSVCYYVFSIRKNTRIPYLPSNLRMASDVRYP